MKSARYVVWKRTGKTTIEAGRFYWRSLAETFMHAQHERYKTAQFRLTNVGENPVWN